MPVPYPEPVQFDQRTAQDAVAALQAAAALLRDHTSADLGGAQRALNGWTGHHADSFRTMDLPWIARESSRILDGLVKLTAAIGSAEGEAVALQHRHDQANQRWLDSQAGMAGRGAR